MMNGNFKKYIYIAVTILIVFFVFTTIFKLLPWLILTGIIIYAVMKIIGFLKGKTKEKDLGNDQKSRDIEYNYKEQADDYTNGEIIDVEYEDIGDKKK